MIKNIPNIIRSRAPRARSDIPPTIRGNRTLTKPSRREPKDKIDRALDVAVGVVLAPALGIQRVLVPVETARVVPLLVAVGSDRNSLALRAVRVAEVDVVRAEVAADNVECG
jgi:hypothetical protein